MLLSDDAFRRLCMARALLRDLREPAPSIRDVAREVRISHFHFIRQFEALFGITPHQFRIQWRVDRAKRLLAGGQHSVTEVCLEVGMSSLGSFSDLFARRVGSAPSSYRVRAQVSPPQELYPGCLSLMACLPDGAFRNFEEAREMDLPLECEGGNHENQTDQHHGG
jgi:AraC-like DNA-binding protein